MDWEKVLKSLANKRRLEITKILLVMPPTKVLDIAREIELSFRSTSKHLIRLHQAGILERKESKGEAHYFINPRLDQRIQKLLKIIF